MYSTHQTKAAQIASSFLGLKWRRVLSKKASICPFEKEEEGIFILYEGVTKEHLEYWYFQHSMSAEELATLWIREPLEEEES
ncbi:MAG: hypothetical protein WA919_05390 [Coleofasciculaceae cyanobacterium]